MMDGTTLLIGPSSVGKSTWIVDQKARGEIAEDRIHFAFQFDGDSPPVLEGKRLIHVNMLHPFSNSADRIEASIEGSAILRKVLAQVRPAEAVVMVAPRAILIKRILLRRALEPDLLGTAAGYPVHPIFEFVCRVDLGEVYRRWFMALNALGIPFRIIATGTPDYGALASPDEAVAYFRSQPAAPYTPEERRQALSQFAFDYQQIDSVGAAGYPREPSYDAIRPFLVGSSAIDIGCGQGYFCRRMELDGFGDVLGTEIKKDRFLAACALGAIDGSAVRYEFGDVLAGPPNRQADTILLLNVLHHLPEPVGGLRKAWAMTAGRLIIEFPTLDDEKFRSTLPAGASIDSSLPLIGVSSLKAVDQTFMFTEAAIARILDESDAPPAELRFLPSPLAPSRRIAVASRSSF